jgi:hypothetical protein
LCLPANRTMMAVLEIMLMGDGLSPVRLHALLGGFFERGEFFFGIAINFTRTAAGNVFSQYFGKAGSFHRFLS